MQNGSQQTGCILWSLHTEFTYSVEYSLLEDQARAHTHHLASQCTMGWFIRSVQFSPREHILRGALLATFPWAMYPCLGHRGYSQRSTKKTSNINHTAMSPQWRREKKSNSCIPPRKLDFPNDPVTKRSLSVETDLTYLLLSGQTSPKFPGMTIPDSSLPRPFTHP